MPTFTIVHEGYQRTCHYTLPAGHNMSQDWPLLVVFHGGGGTGLNFNQNITGNTLGDATNAAGFITMYPEAYEEHWNDGKNMLWSSNVLGIDDVGFILALVDYAEANWRASQSNVFITGMSNGGHMCYRMIQDAGARISGAAIVVSNLASLRSRLHTSRSIPLLIFNGTVDPLMPFGGGDATIDTELGPQTVNYLSTPNTCFFWASHAGLSLGFVKDILPNVDPTDGTTVERSTWSGAVGPMVVLYSVLGGGHTWPGGVQYLPQFLVGKVTHDILASDIMVSFFQDLIVLHGNAGLTGYVRPRGQP